MGVLIYNTKSKISMPYSTFNDGRNKIAHLLDEEWGNLREYHTKWMRKNFMTATTAEIKRFQDEWEEVSIHLICSKKLDPDITDFLLQSDCGGKINYKTAKKIFNLIKDYPGRLFIESGIILNEDEGTEQFKEMLQYCYSHHADLKWE